MTKIFIFILFFFTNLFGIDNEKKIIVGAERIDQYKELIKGIDNGILIQSVTGLHSGVNPISGDFSTGAEGLRIRNGELSEPLREFTIGSTIQKMLKDIKEVGNDTDWLPMSSAGSTVVINELTVSGG